MFDFENVEGMVFDCDGTLLDTLGAWDEAERDLFARTGPLSQEQEDEIHSAPIEHAAEIFHVKYGVGNSAEEVLAHLDGHLLPFYAEKAEPLSGAVDFVMRAHERGIACVVVSSSPRRYLQAGLKRAGILQCFSELVTTDETGCSKQDAAIYARAERLLGASRGRIWAFDDAPYAIAAMNEFGFKTACIGSRDSELAELNPASFDELLA